MRTIKKNLACIGGGNPAVLGVIEGVGLFIAIPEIGSALGHDWSYSQIGAGLGEWIYETTHPNQLGQMEYSVGDFGYSYIPSAFPIHYPHS